MSLRVSEHCGRQLLMRCPTLSKSWSRWLGCSRHRPSEVRVRFAPSPTGHLHLGGFRTALYNFFFAKANNGKFILRIEDTDQSRTIAEAAKKLEDVLVWAKIPPDESPVVGGAAGPYVQSQRIHLYRTYIKILLENGTAYKCFCTEKRLSLLRKDALQRREIPKYDNKCRHLSTNRVEKLESQGFPFCIRFKLEAILEPFQDLVYGPVLHNVADLEGDPVVMKSDGFPTYHFANVVDDHLMGVTHVLRGVEWQVSTPKHLLLYKAFGWTPPEYAHLPLIKNADGTKLSKRQGDIHIEYLRSQGYSAEALLNFVTNISGGFEERDHDAFLSLEELSEKFRLSKISTMSGRLEMEKLGVLNQRDLQRRLSIAADIPPLLNELRIMILERYGDRFSSSAVQASVLNPDYLRSVLMWAQERIETLQDLLTPEFSYIWIVPDELPLNQLPSMTCSHGDVVQGLIKALTALPQENFTKEQIPILVKAVGKDYKLKTPAIMKLVRMAVSGLKEGPPIAEMLFILGQQTTIDRLSHTLKLLQSR